MKTEHYFNTFVLCFVLLLGFGYWYGVRPVDEVEPASVEESSNITFNFDGDFGAEGVLVVDMNENKILFGQNTTIPYPLASLSKIVVALVALEGLHDQSIIITHESIVQSGDKGLRVGEKWSVPELVQFMLVTSSNDAAYAIASSVAQEGEPVTQNFTRMMNSYVRNLGMTDTYFLGPTGLDDDFYGVTGYGTTRDMYTLMRLALQKFPEIFLSSSQTKDYFTSQDNFVHQAENTNVIADRIPSLIFSKTGYTDDAGGNLVFMFEHGPHYPIGAVILGSSFSGRFDDAMSIVEAVQ